MATNVTPQTWAASVLRALGIRQTPGAMRAMVGWAAAEGGHWNNDAQHNPLNTTQPMPGAGNTGTQGNIKVYKNWQQGVDATVKTLRNGHYGGILAALRSGNANAVADAIGQTPWGTHGDLVRRTIASTPTSKGATPLLPGASSDGARPTPSSIDIDVPQLTESFDEAGFEKARRRAVIGQMIAKRNPHSLLLTTGALSTTMPSAGDYKTSEVTTKTEKVAIPGQPATPDQSVPSSGTGGAVGIATFEGKKVPAWMLPSLKYARAHGWTGAVNNGVRTRAEQGRLYANRGSNPNPVARPGTSNHEIDSGGGGAVDVSAPDQFERIIRAFKGRKPRRDPAIKDPVHFSASGR